MTDRPPVRDDPRPPRCALCGKPQAERFRPFCSKRCSDIDLNRWLSGVYAVPAAAADDEADQPSDGPPPD